jgi:hypothetical protein
MLATLKTETISSTDAIPLDYGNLIAVTTSPPHAQLWFEKADKTIVLVRLNYVSGGINNSVTIIPRR